MRTQEPYVHGPYSIGYSLDDDCLFVELIRAPGQYKEAICQLVAIAKEHVKDKLRGVVKGEARLRLFTSRGWKQVGRISNDKYVVELTIE